jgi:hypothetical protein
MVQGDKGVGHNDTRISRRAVIMVWAKIFFSEEKKQKTFWSLSRFCSEPPAMISAT